jgi:hypothetical protein
MRKSFLISLKWWVPVLSYLVYVILMSAWLEVDVLLWGTRHGGGGVEFGRILLFVFLAALIPIGISSW